MDISSSNGKSGAERLAEAVEALALAKREVRVAAAAVAAATAEEVEATITAVTTATAAVTTATAAVTAATVEREKERETAKVAAREAAKAAAREVAKVAAREAAKVAAREDAAARAVWEAARAVRDAAKVAAREAAKVAAREAAAARKAAKVAARKAAKVAAREAAKVAAREDAAARKAAKVAAREDAAARKAAKVAAREAVTMNTNTNDNDKPSATDVLFGRGDAVNNFPTASSIPIAAIRNTNMDHKNNNNINDVLSVNFDDPTDNQDQPARKKTKYENLDKDQDPIEIVSSSSLEHADITLEEVGSSPTVDVILSDQTIKMKEENLDKDPIQILSSSLCDLSEESIALFGQKSSNLIQKILEDGKHLDGEVKEHFPEQECALIVYSNHEKELLMYGTHLSTVQIVSDSRLLVKIGTRVHRDGMLGEVVLNEQPHNFHLLEFMDQGEVIYDVVTYDEIKNLPIADHTLFEDDKDNKNNNKTYNRAIFKRRASIGWTPEEDAKVTELVKIYGDKKWTFIARQMNERSGKQCRERWCNHLNPDINKGEWTSEEDKALIQAHAEIGNRWVEISKRLMGRTDNAIKNRWNTTLKQITNKEVSPSCPHTPSSLARFPNLNII